jgi:hypothetical protein
MEMIQMQLTPLEFKEVREAIRLAKTVLHGGITDDTYDVLDYLNNAEEILDGQATTQDINI